MPPQVLRIGPSCLECRRRKIKCDRSIPCSYCVKTRIQCVYPDTALESVSTQENVLDRMQRIESKLETLQQDMHDIKLLLQMNLPSRREEDETTGLDELMLTLMNEEYNDFPAVMPTSAQAQGGETGEKRRVPAFLSNGSLPTLGPFHPSPGMAVFILHRFIDNVDPMLKLLHIPTVQTQFLNAARELDSVDPQMECIMFAIYYSTIVDMSPEDCRTFFHTNKEFLLHKFRTGVEVALARVDLRNSPCITSLQAYVLYISSRTSDNNQGDNGPNAQSLIGTAIHSALRLKLHHHDTIMSFSPFEAEMRRRLWWHICVLDVCIAAAHSNDPLILEKSFNTPFPSDLNDSDLDPDMKELPIPSPTVNPATIGGGKGKNKRSEIFFTLLRFEIGYFARQFVFSEDFCRKNVYTTTLSSTSEEKVDAINAFRESIESQYLTHFDAMTAFDNRVVIAARFILDTIKKHVSSSQGQSRSQTPSPSRDVGSSGNRKIKIDIREVIIIDLAGPVIHPSYITGDGGGFDGLNLDVDI